MIEKQKIYELGITLGSKLQQNLKLPMFNISDKLLKGFAEIVELRQGLKLIINDYKPKKDLIINFNVETPPLEFAFCLSGEARALIKFNDNSRELNFQEGNSVIFYLPNSSGQIHISSKDSLRIVSLHVSPNFLRNFMDNDFSGINDDLKDIINGNLQNNLLIDHDVTSQMKLALGHIYDNNYSGTARKMFLESKALELMTLQLTRLMEMDDSNGIKIKKTDLNKIEMVKKIIDEEYVSPPSLNVLTAKAGISHTKLNYLFKLMYHSTVFEFIRKKRLEYSLKLLIESDLSITDIAYEAGWSNPGHFTREFKKQYELSPKKYREEIIRY